MIRNIIAVYEDETGKLYIWLNGYNEPILIDGDGRWVEEYTMTREEAEETLRTGEFPERLMRMMDENS